MYLGIENNLINSDKELTFDIFMLCREVSREEYLKKREAKKLQELE
jgi:hypothetical protein